MIKNLNKDEINMIKNLNSLKGDIEGQRNEIANI